MERSTLRWYLLVLQLTVRMPGKTSKLRLTIGDQVYETQPAHSLFEDALIDLQRQLSEKP